MSANSTLKRTRRIERRCIPAVVEAFHSGQISARSADVFLSLPQAEQAQELNRRLSEAHEREALHRVVATAIKQYLDGLGNQKVDLIELGKIIKKALAA
jgi:hypothetical protein